MIEIFNMERKILRYRKEIEQAICETLDSGQLVLGRQVSEFEHEFASYLKAKNFVSVANGTDALEIAMRTVGIRKNSKVALVANAGNYSRTVINLIEAHPIYMDVDFDSRNIQLENVKIAIAHGAEFVIATHLYGKAIDEIDEIAEYCAKRGISLIEDCAQAHGAKINGNFVGTFGDLACFSFYPTKNLGALGDAGGIATNSDALASRIKSLRTYGWEEKYRVILKYGRNSRMDELQAAVLRKLLRTLDQENLKRREIAHRYTLANSKRFFQMPKFISDDYVAHLFVVTSKNPNQAISHFNKMGIATASHYPILDINQHYLAGEEDNIHLPVSQHLSEYSFTLPCNPELLEEEIVQVEKAIADFQES
jgi:aminotransferase EvaB